MSKSASRRFLDKILAPIAPTAKLSPNVNTRRQLEALEEVKAPQPPPRRKKKK